MIAKITSQLARMEAEQGGTSEGDEVAFNVYLVKESKLRPGKYLRKLYPSGKYKRIADPSALGIEPYKPSRKPSIAVCANPSNPSIDATRKANPEPEKVETAEERLSRIAAAIERDFERNDI